MAKKQESAKKTAEKKPATKKKSSDSQAEPFDRSKYWSSEDVAKNFGITAARVSQLKRDGVIIPAITGSRKEGDFYKPAETCIRGVRFYRELSDSRGSRETEEMKKARERQLIARARKEELELSEYEGEMHKAEDIERIIGAGLSRLRINLLAIPLGVAPLIKDRDNINEIAEIISERIYRALHEVANIDINKMMAEEESLQSE